MTDDQPPRERGPLLSCERLKRFYGDQPVVDVHSLEVQRGEVLALLGPNGAGKSTLMRLLAGLERPDRGRVRYKNRIVAPDDPALRQAAAAVLQHPYLWRGTVAQNVEYGLRVRGEPRWVRKRQVQTALEMLDVVELKDAPVDTLSGGEAQRVALARALAVEPEVLFLDEPTADLDIAVRRRLLADLERILRQTAPAIVLITHDPGEAFALADRVAVMERGRIVQTGTPADIFESPATEFVASFTGAEFMLDGEVEAVNEGTLTVRLDSGAALEVVGAANVGARVRVAYRPEDVVIAPPSIPATSARNRFTARIAGLHPQGGLVRLRLTARGLSLEAVITRHSLDELHLQAATEVVAQIKATAFHVFVI
jgi:molybdopterin-binding protein